MAQFLDTEVVDGISVVRIDRPPANALAAELLDEGAELIEAASALAWDVVDEVVEPAAVLDRALQVAREFAALPRTTYEAVKQQLRGEALERMIEASDRDPLARGWLSSEMPDAARSVLEGTSG